MGLFNRAKPEEKKQKSDFDILREYVEKAENVQTWGIGNCDSDYCQNVLKQVYVWERLRVTYDEEERRFYIKRRVNTDILGEFNGAPKYAFEAYYHDLTGSYAGMDALWPYVALYVAEKYVNPKNKKMIVTYYMVPVFPED